eukprot:3590350-Prymnesium_polylepis.1
MGRTSPAARAGSRRAPTRPREHQCCGRATPTGSRRASAQTRARGAARARQSAWRATRAGPRRG